MGLTKNLGWISKYLTLDSSGAATFASSITANGNSVINGGAGSDPLYLQKSTGASLGLSGATGTTNKVIIVASNSTNPDMLVYAGGSERMRITSDGNVGIGTTSPSAKLNVSGDIHIGDYGSSTSRALDFRTGNSVFTITTEGTSGGLGTTFTYSWAAGGQGPLKFNNAAGEVMRLSSFGNVGIGTTSPSAKLEVRELELSKSQTTVSGNSNTQGTAQFITWVKQVPVVSLGTKLIIPFFSQGSLNSTTIIRIMGHGALFNNTNPLGFEAFVTVGHLNLIYSATILRRSGNISSIPTINGMNVELNFTSGYTSATANGVFVTLEYMTNVQTYSIDTANIRMN